MSTQTLRNFCLTFLGIALVGLGACAGTGTQKTAGETIDDSVLTAKVKSALIADKEVAATDINVETNKGRVQLAGYADDQAEIDRAGQIARDVEGVKSVSNDVKLKSAR